MKKMFFLFMLAVVLTANSYAQYFGLNGGGGSANFKLKNIDHLSKEVQDLSKPTLYLQLGLPFEISLSENLSIQSGIFFAGTWDYISYRQVPLNIQYNWDLGFMVPFLQAGPNYFFCGEVPASSDPQNKNVTHFSGFGYSFGAGLQFKNVQLSYNVGFCNNIPLPYTNDVKGNFISKSFSVTWFFDFGDWRRSSHRKFPAPSHLSSSYWQTINVPNTSARDMTKQMKLRQSLRSDYYYITPLRTENAQMGYKVNNYDVLINPNQIEVGFRPVVDRNYIIASKRNEYKRLLSKKDTEYSNKVKELNLFTSDLKEMFDYSQISDNAFKKLMLSGIDEINSGTEELKNEQFKKAEEFFAKAARIFYLSAIARPNDEDALFCYGYTLFLIKKYEEAKIVLELIPKHENSKNYIKTCEEIIAKRGRIAEGKREELEDLIRKRNEEIFKMIGDISNGL